MVDAGFVLKKCLNISNVYMYTRKMKMNVAE